MATLAMETRRGEMVTLAIETGEERWSHYYGGREERWSHLAMGQERRDGHISYGDRKER